MNNIRIIDNVTGSDLVAKNKELQNTNEYLYQTRCANCKKPMTFAIRKGVSIASIDLKEIKCKNCGCSLQ